MVCTYIPIILHKNFAQTNNFLFKYDEKTGKPLEVKFLDFQIARVCSRTIDLTYFLYTSPKMDILNNKEKELLQIYYDEFNAFVKKLGSEGPDSSFEEFHEEYNRFRPFGISLG